MSSHNDVEPFQTGEPPEELKNRLQFTARRFESQNLQGVY
jgi:hypothetical protein